MRGEGVWLYDAHGRAYLDVYNNVPHIGHCHPTVVAAIARQSSVLATHTRYLHPGILDYAEELIRGLPPGLDSCIFVNSGSEANDVAWRIAKMASGHDGALIMDHAYHGITDAVGALTPGSGAPAVPWVVALAPPPQGSMTPQELSQTDADAQRARVAAAGGSVALVRTSSHLAPSRGGAGSRARCQQAFAVARRGRPRSHEWNGDEEWLRRASRSSRVAA